MLDVGHACGVVDVEYDKILGIVVDFTIQANSSKLEARTYSRLRSDIRMLATTKAGNREMVCNKFISVKLKTND